MELIHGRRKTSKFVPEDVIGNMPDIVITNILDRLPLQDAVRTGVLSRNWRFKWTMLSQLIFDEEFYVYLLETRNENSYWRIISRLLLHLSGAITKFVLIIDDLIDDKDINDWILFLSRKGTKDLTLKNIDETPLKLPTHLFYCLELKHLKVYNCCFNPPLGFHAFPNLLTLELCLFDESSELRDFLTRCPLLEILNLGCIGNVKLVEIAKLENLKILSFSLCDLDPTITSSSTIFELVGYLRKLQELDLDFLHCELTEEGAKKSFHPVFPCLKALTLSKIDLDDDNMVSCFFEMIRSFPNLQTLEITSRESIDTLVTPAICSLFCSPEMYTMRLLQLQSVVFTYYKASVNDLYLIKYLLACSPFLKRIVIRPRFLFLVSRKKSMFDRKLLQFHRASPVVDIDLSSFYLF